MQKYTTFDRIRKNEISYFAGLKNECFVRPQPSHVVRPITVSHFGITNPDPEYHIKRTPSSIFVLEYVVSGKGCATINGTEYNLEAGDAYLIHPGDTCDYYADKEDPYKKYWINFIFPLYAELLKAYGLNDLRVIKGIDLEPYFERLFALEQVSTLNDDLYLPVTGILFEIFIKIALIEEEKKKRAVSEIAWRVKHEMECRINTPTTLEDIEKMFFVPKSEIIREFKKAYGITPYAYLLEHRIQMAKQLLSTTKKSVAEISDYLCFSSEYYFSNYFKKCTGYSPRQFRKLPIE